jgi:hypothetical protein
MERFLLLPLEEEGWLNDMPLRENFIERVFAAQFCLRQTARSHGLVCSTRSQRFRRADDLGGAAKRPAAWSLSLRSGQASSIPRTS